MATRRELLGRPLNGNVGNRPWSTRLKLRYGLRRYTCLKGASARGRTKAQDFASPAILLGSPVDYDMYKSFRSQLDSSAKEGLVVTELSTLGGNPEVARMMGEDIRFHRENSKNGRFVFSERRQSIPPGRPS